MDLILINPQLAQLHNAYNKHELANMHCLGTNIHQCSCGVLLFRGGGSRIEPAWFALERIPAELAYKYRSYIHSYLKWALANMDYWEEMSGVEREDITGIRYALAQRIIEGYNKCHPQ
jgi:hypothetical protein